MNPQIVTFHICFLTKFLRARRAFKRTLSCMDTRVGSIKMRRKNVSTSIGFWNLYKFTLNWNPAWIVYRILQKGIGTFSHQCEPACDVSALSFHWNPFHRLYKCGSEVHGQFCASSALLNWQKSCCIAIVHIWKSLVFQFLGWLVAQSVNVCLHHRSDEFLQPLMMSKLNWKLGQKFQSGNL